MKTEDLKVGGYYTFNKDPPVSNIRRIKSFIRTDGVRVEHIGVNGNVFHEATYSIEFVLKDYSVLEGYKIKQEIKEWLKEQST